MHSKNVDEFAFASRMLLAVTLAGSLTTAWQIRAQSTLPATPRFEVASVKRCKDEPGFKSGGGESTPGRVSTGCLPLADVRGMGLIRRAYVRFAGGHPNPLGILPVEGGPAWIRSEFYDINARADGNPRQGVMEGPMMQALLEDRFKLKLHRETRQIPVYALTAVKVAKLKPFQEGSCVPSSDTFLPPTLAEGQRPCRALVSRLSVVAEGATILEFSKLLTLAVDRPVIEKTGLMGRYDINLEFSADQSIPGPPGTGGSSPAAAGTAADPRTTPSIFTAVQEQLGLKLAPAKGPGEFLVVDHVERPSEN
jgi:uncharacterized protein (TIGR03435 family)